MIKIVKLKGNKSNQLKLEIRKKKRMWMILNYLEVQEILAKIIADT